MLFLGGRSRRCRCSTDQSDLGLGSSLLGLPNTNSKLGLDRGIEEKATYVNSIGTDLLANWALIVFDWAKCNANGLQRYLIFDKMLVWYVLPSLLSHFHVFLGICLQPPPPDPLIAAPSIPSYVLLLASPVGGGAEIHSLHKLVFSSF